MPYDWRALFDRLSSGAVPLDETGQNTVSQAFVVHARAYRDQLGVTIVSHHAPPGSSTRSPWTSRPELHHRVD